MGDEQTTMEPRTRAALPDQTYVVQRLTRMPGKRGAGALPFADQTAKEDAALVDVDMWQDVATVTVPGRTLRKTVVEKALTEAGIVPEVGKTLKVRVLDADAAAIFPVGSVQPPPQLQIGEAA